MGLIFFNPTLGGNAANAENSESTKESNKVANKRIFLALLLDTSNSMDGLIDQAKSQLWNIVNELAEAKYNDQPVDLSISLYEYGNDALSITSGYIRQVSRFTTDLDEISSELFALDTNGGSEFCGTVIKHSLDNLDWGNDPEELKLVFIAGNEPFNQGTIDYKEQCLRARDKGIEINTIFCGNYDEGKNTEWKNGADLANGEYLNIDMDQKTVYVETPYDKDIEKLNNDLNDTYLAYGSIGKARKEQQLQQDSNAQFYGTSNKVSRAISKSSHVYKNVQWDLVDAINEDAVDLEKVKEDELPEEMQSMTIAERKTYVEEKSVARGNIQKQIQELAGKRQAFIKDYNDKLSIDNPLEEVILGSVRKAAKRKFYKFK